ncbi:MAG TPA: integration host factor, actinobacterial type [Actinomycetota bacterium]|nr:integration host factor, actinobacterial type [Actinomycetota bacterium]
MPPPSLSAEQRSAASAKAVLNRRRRAEVKEQLRAGRLSWAQLVDLAHSDEVVAGLRVQDALLSMPGVGPQRLTRFMKSAGVSPSRRLRGLGRHQTAALAEILAR